jgi:hypothetical protein
MDVNKNLSKFFNVEEPQSSSISVPQLTGTSSEDYDFARNNLKNLIATGSQGLEGILKVASESDSPRAYEVLANTLKTLADINVNLMDLAAKQAQANKVNVQNTTNNSIFVGTTKELQTMLKKQTNVIEGEVLNDSKNRIPSERKS